MYITIIILYHFLFLWSLSVTGLEGRLYCSIWILAKTVFLSVFLHKNLPSKALERDFIGDFQLMYR